MGSCARGPRYYVTRFDVRPEWARIHYVDAGCARQRSSRSGTHSVGATRFFDNVTFLSRGRPRHPSSPFPREDPIRANQPSIIRFTDASLPPLPVRARPLSRDAHPGYRIASGTHRTGPALCRALFRSSSVCFYLSSSSDDDDEDDERDSSSRSLCRSFARARARASC